jgi:long-chain acyl-CoA synthetase
MNNSDYERNLKSLKNIILDLNGDEPFIGHKADDQYQFRTYNEAAKNIENLSNFFGASSLASTFKYEDREHKLIGIFTKPREEAFLTTLALHLADVTVLSVYDTIEESKLIKILEHSNVESLVIDEYCLNKLLKILKVEDNFDAIPVKNLILVGEFENCFDDCGYKNFKVYNFNEILEKGDKKKNKPKAEHNTNSKDSNNDIVLLNYTNELKGVLFKESAILEHLKFLLENKLITQLPQAYSFYSMNSLAEIPEYLLCLVTMLLKGRIGFMSDHIRIFEDLKSLKPHFLYSFPKVLVKVYESFETIINKLDYAKRLMFDKAIKIKIDSCNDGCLNHHIWDKLLFDKIKNSMGGEIQLIFIGGGHLANHYMEFLKACLSCFIIEFYGNTESLGLIAEGNEKNNHFIGNIIGNLEFKITKAKKIGYYPINTEEEIHAYGEFCVKGGNMSCGYLYEDSLLDKDGFMHTGDYVVHLNSGIKYIDKIDNFIITKDGEVVSPYQLEQYYISCEKICHISVTQDDRDHELIAIVRLKKSEVLSSQSKSRKGSFSSNGSGKKIDNGRKTYPKKKVPENLLDSTNDTTPINNNDEPDMDSIKEEILSSFKTIWNDNKLKSYELISRVYIISNSIIYKQSNKLLTKRLNFDKKVLKQLIFYDDN